MKQKLTRRRFLAISAAAAALPSKSSRAAPIARWTGSALGATASIVLAGLYRAEAGKIFESVERELERLEGIFSLYRADSLLVHLNRTGRLRFPPPALIDLLDLSRSLCSSTDGAFDPSIQPLWLLHAARAGEGRRPSAEEIDRTRRRCGWEGLEYSRHEVSFKRAGMALTFNGIAQGYIADRIAGLLRRSGLTDVLIDMGEIAALGRREDATPWRAAIALPDGKIVKRLKLRERALATSGPLGTLLDPAGRIGHIMDPRSGRATGHWQLVSVSAGRAALADGLSTAFCLMSRDAIASSLRSHPEASLEVLV